MSAAPPADLGEKLALASDALETAYDVFVLASMRAVLETWSPSSTVLMFYGTARSEDVQWVGQEDAARAAFHALRNAPSPAHRVLDRLASINEKCCKLLSMPDSFDGGWFAFELDDDAVLIHFEVYEHGGRCPAHRGPESERPDHEACAACTEELEADEASHDVAVEDGYDVDLTRYTAASFGDLYALLRRSAPQRQANAWAARDGRRELWQREGRWPRGRK